MDTPQRYETAALGLSGTRYTVEQTGTDKNFRPEYEARDVSGDTIFRCTYNMYEGNDTFPFIDTDGTELFTVEASGNWNIAGDYLLTDSQTGEELVVLDNDLSLFQDTWRIRDAEDGSLLAEINSRGTPFTVGRKLLPVGQWIGHKFEITDAEGDSVGTIKSDFAVFDEYEITINDSSSVPVDPIVAGTAVIDAIQGN
ncbi:hypothetical protein ACFQL1_06080 [Halomicroarcula sp. GCM10025709]|uniref:hypothetical protein n=1 Tax=Haloarcula TaxID=2237 RepID=UPI0024C2226A|nr:hypothetical protein [Halomicroarcula sp. YJ-61-S]